MFGRTVPVPLLGTTTLGAAAPHAGDAWPHQVAGGVRGIPAELQHPKINSKWVGGGSRGVVGLTPSANKALGST